MLKVVIYQSCNRYNKDLSHKLEVNGDFEQYNTTKILLFNSLDEAKTYQVVEQKHIDKKLTLLLCEYKIDGLTASKISANSGFVVYDDDSRVAFNALIKAEKLPAPHKIIPNSQEDENECDSRSNQV